MERYLKKGIEFIPLYKFILEQQRDIHIFFKYPPKLSPSKIAMQFKGISSYLLRKEFPELREEIKDKLWAPSNYHGSVGLEFEVGEKYIETQRDRH